MSEYLVNQAISNNRFGEFTITASGNIYKIVQEGIVWGESNFAFKNPIESEIRKFDVNAQETKCFILTENSLIIVDLARKRENEIDQFVIDPSIVTDIMWSPLSEDDLVICLEGQIFNFSTKTEESSDPIDTLEEIRCIAIGDKDSMWGTFSLFVGFDQTLEIFSPFAPKQFTVKADTFADLFMTLPVSHASAFRNVFRDESDGFATDDFYIAPSMFPVDNEFPDDIKSIKLVKDKLYVSTIDGTVLTFEAPTILPTDSPQTIHLNQINEMHLEDGADLVVYGSKVYAYANNKYVDVSNNLKLYAGNDENERLEQLKKRRDALQERQRKIDERRARLASLTDEVPKELINKAKFVEEMLRSPPLTEKEKGILKELNHISDILDNIEIRVKNSIEADKNDHTIDDKIGEIREKLDYIKKE